MARKLIADTVDWPAVEARLESTLRAATARQWREGSRWYPQANAIASNLGATIGRDVRAGAGIIAALSPQAHWDLNVRQATDLCEGREIANTFSRLGKAQEILEGSNPSQVLGGTKERAFYHSIGDPSGCRTACIDRHMLRIALALETHDEIKLWGQRSQVPERISDAIGKIADRHNLSVPTVQAIIWTVVRDGR